jgi:DNA polymerase
MIVDAYVSMSEDEHNSYYTGRSGMSLRNMIEKVLLMNINDVYMTHAVKCRPLGSKEPSKSEFDSCKAYLFKQIELIKPKIIIALGRDAYMLITDDNTPFEQVRGQKIAFASFTLVPIYHPTFLLRNPSLKRDTLNDLNKIKSLL